MSIERVALRSEWLLVQQAIGSALDEFQPLDLTSEQLSNKRLPSLAEG